MLPLKKTIKTFNILAIKAAILLILSPPAFSQKTMSEDGVYALARLSALEFNSSETTRANRLNKVSEETKSEQHYARLSSVEFVEHAVEMFQNAHMSERKFVEKVFNSSNDRFTRIYTPTELSTPIEHATKIQNKSQRIGIGSIVDGNCELPAIAESTTSLLIDLRGNGGGKIECAERLMTTLLSQGDHSYTITTNTGSEKRKISGELEKGLNEKTVLVDKHTASSAELMMWLLEEDGYKIIGEETYGKNLIQSYYQAHDYMYAITVGMFTTNNCQSIGCTHK